MTIQQYLDAKQTARNSVDTLMRNVRVAYDQAQANTRDVDENGNLVGYDRLDKLVNDADRAIFKGVINDNLTAPLQGMIGAMPEYDSEIAKSLAMNGFYGFTDNTISQIVDNTKENISFDAYQKILAEQTDLKKTIGVRQQSPTNILDGVSATDVLTYVGVTARDPDVVTLKDKVELIDTFEINGIVPPNFLQGKPYM